MICRLSKQLHGKFMPIEGRAIVDEEGTWYSKKNYEIYVHECGRQHTTPVSPITGNPIQGVEETDRFEYLLKLYWGGPASVVSSNY